MHKAILLACCAASLSFSSAIFTDQSQKHDISKNKNVTLLKTVVGKFSSSNLNKINVEENGKTNSTVHAKFNKTGIIHNAINHGNNNYSFEEAQKKLPILQKIHARITRSKDAVWAAITLTFMCVLLVLAVAQSRMWNDNHYSEAQGVPLPNFNERVLFKDVMEHKISTLKKFFKKKSDNNVTELESLLPPSEWDN